MECHFHPADYLNPADLKRNILIEMKMNFGREKKKKKREETRNFGRLKLKWGKEITVTPLGFFLLFIPFVLHGERNIAASFEGSTL